VGDLDDPSAPSRRPAVGFQSRDHAGVAMRDASRMASVMGGRPEKNVFKPGRAGRGGARNPCVQPAVPARMSQRGCRQVGVGGIGARAASRTAMWSAGVFDPARPTAASRTSASRVCPEAEQRWNPKLFFPGRCALLFLRRWGGGGPPPNGRIEFQKHQARVPQGLARTGRHSPSRVSDSCAPRTVPAAARRHRSDQGQRLSMCPAAATR